MTGPKVLLVDDNKDEIFLTQRSLEKKNFEVVSVTSITEAFRQIASQPFDVLITDLHIPEPGMDSQWSLPCVMLNPTR
jgi:CheY-like chemotaxis protein